MAKSKNYGWQKRWKIDGNKVTYITGFTCIFEDNKDGTFSQIVSKDDATRKYIAYAKETYDNDFMDHYKRLHKEARYFYVLDRKEKCSR